MKLSDREIQRKIEAITALQGQSEKLRQEVESIDITEHIAPVYKTVHSMVENGEVTFINLPGGRGSGKSSYTSCEIVDQVMKDETGLSNALIIRKYASTLRGSVFNQIQWAIDELGVSHLWKAQLEPMQFVYKTGQTIRLSGLDDPTKLKSMRPKKGYYMILWIEEFSEIFGEIELRNLQQSVLRGGDRFIVFRSFNPPVSAANWANKYVERQDAKTITFHTNYTMMPREWLGDLFFEEAEKLKEINLRAYENEYLGLAVGSGSEVFPNLQIREITDEEIRKQTYIFQGLDFGFSSDPCAFVRVSYDSKTDTIFFLDEIVKKGCSNKEIADLIIERGYQTSNEIYHSQFYGVFQREKQIVTCDCAEPKSIADLKDCGIRAIPCQKFPGCVQYRIKWLQHRRIVIDPNRTPESAREFQNYNYVIDRKSGEITSELPDKDNHTIDSCAYALDRIIYNKGISA